MHPSLCPLFLQLYNKLYLLLGLLVRMWTFPTAGVLLKGAAALLSMFAEMALTLVGDEMFFCVSRELQFHIVEHL